MLLPEPAAGARFRPEEGLVFALRLLLRPRREQPLNAVLQVTVLDLK